MEDEDWSEQVNNADCSKASNRPSTKSPSTPPKRSSLGVWRAISSTECDRELLSEATSVERERSDATPVPDGVPSAGHELRPVEPFSASRTFFTAPAALLPRRGNSSSQAERRQGSAEMFAALGGGPAAGEVRRP